MLELDFEKTLGAFRLKSQLKMEKGVLGILGPSGCGKSMTLKCIAGLEKPDSGHIHLDGIEFFSSNKGIHIPTRTRNIGYVFQNYALWPHMTVEQNIAYGLKHLKKSVRQKKVADMIEKMQLSNLLRHYPSQLSGGQQQRAALARTLVTEPKLLMLDEPFSALDSHIKYLLEKELMSMIENNYDGLVLLVTHNIEEAYRMCDHIMVMDYGHNLQMAPKETLIKNPKTITAARLTGCNNFLKVEVLQRQENRYILKSKGLTFIVEGAFEHLDTPNMAGIRAQNLSLHREDQQLDHLYPCEVITVIEGVFSTKVIVNCGDNVFQVEGADKMCYDDPLCLHIPADAVFLMDTAETS